jgi:hypothetical protein
MKSGILIHLSIADFMIELSIPPSVSFILDDGLVNFVVWDERTKLKKKVEDKGVDLRISCRVGCENAPKTWTNEIYCAPIKSDVLWRIFKMNNGICIHVFDPNELKKLQHIAFYHQLDQTWSIYSNSCDNVSLESLSYPMMPLILYYLSTQKEAIFIHASGVYDGKMGRIFSGFSGIGKSTLATIWRLEGAQVINDDRLILRKIDEKWWMFNTPMYYRDTPRKAPLHFIYLPFHDLANSHKPIKGIHATMKLMAHCIQHGYNSTDVNQLLNIVLDLTKTTSIAHLGVVPNKEICQFIYDHETFQ